MALSLVDYVLINGARYRPVHQKFSRFDLPAEVSQLSGKRVQSPFLDAELLGFEAGEGLRTLDDTATGYYAGNGMEPVDEVPTSGHTRLKVGRQLTVAYDPPTGEGILAAAVYNDLAFFMEKAGRNYLWEHNGTTWTSRDYSALVVGFGIGPFLVWQGRLYFGTGVNSIVYYTGGVFTAVGMTAGYVNWRALGANETYSWWLADNTLLTPNRTVLVRMTASHVVTVVATFSRSRGACGVIVNGTVYAWAYDGTSPAQPSAQVYTTAADGTGTPALGAIITDNYPLTAVEHNGEVWLGLAWGGRIVKYASGQYTTMGQFGATTAPATTPGTDAIYALFSFAGSLYAAGYDSAAASGSRTWLRRYTAAGGWHKVSVGGLDASIAIRSMTAYQQQLFLGDEEATIARIYAHSKTARLLAADLEAPNVVYGSETVPKWFAEVSVTHDALVSGQAVELRYVLDGGAEVSVGTNKDIGSTETRFSLPSSVKGRRLRPRFYFTNTSAADLIVSGVRVRCLPQLPQAEVWETDLDLYPLTAWNDGTADTDDALTKYEALRALKVTGQPFQVVDIFRDGTTPKRAMLAAFDPLAHLEWSINDLGPTRGVQIILPVRLLQAAQPMNMVKNASFEQPGSGAAPTDWTVTGTGTSSLVSNTRAQDGSNSLKLIFDGVSASYGREQVIPGLIAGRYYTLSVYAFRDTLSAGVVQAYLYDGAWNAGITNVAAGTDTAFVRYTATFLYSGTGGGATVVVAGAGTPAGTVYVDAVMVEEGAPVSAFAERGSTG